MNGDDLLKQEHIDLDRITQYEEERERTRTQRDKDDERIGDIEREKQNPNK